MNFIKRIERVALWKKFICLGLLCLAVVVMPTLMYWNEVQKTLAFTAREQQGLPQIQLMLNIIQRTQQHRGLCARFLQDDHAQPKAQRAKAEELEDAISDFEIYLNKNMNVLRDEEFEDMVDAWHELHQKVSKKEINYIESFDLHTVLIYTQLQFLQSLVDSYQLSLDPDADGYFLIEASLMQLPELVETLGQVRGYGVGLLTKGNATLEEQAQLKALLLMSEAKMKSMDASVRKAVAAKKEHRENIYQNYQATKLQYQKIAELTRAEILEKDGFSYSADSFYSSFTVGLNSYYSYASFAIQQLDVILSERVASNKHSMTALLTYEFFLILIVAIVWIGFVRKLLRQLGGEPHYTTEVVQAITRGDLNYEIDTQHADSLLANVKLMQEKLKESDRLKSEFVSTVSHELRTPLTAISGALSLSVSGQLGELPAPALKLLDIAQKNSVRLTELINDLLDFDKLSVGKLELDMRIQPLMPIIDDACLSMTSYAQKYGVRLQVGPRFEYVLVNVDARRLRQVLVNFLSNAAKFSHKGDEIIINTSVHFDKVRIEVIDHGRGIPEEFHGKIFHRFTQADGSATRASGGTGLGLAIAKELVQHMNGTIGFSSTEGVGSCFYFELPLEEPNSD
jgi:signal transduction histidine kinase